MVGQPGRLAPRHGPQGGAQLRVDSARATLQAVFLQLERPQYQSAERSPSLHPTVGSSPTQGALGWKRG